MQYNRDKGKGKQQKFVPKLKDSYALVSIW